MLKIPQELSSDDVQQWVGDCIVLAPLREQEGPLLPIHVAGLRVADRTFLQGTALPSLQTVHVPRDWAYMTWPRCGAVNVFPLALYVQRTQVKSYRRSYHKRGVSVSVPEQARAVSVVGGEAVESALNFRTYTAAVFNPSYPDTHEAMTMLDNGWFSVALSPTTVVIQGDAGINHVYYNGALAAKLCHGTLVSLMPRLPRAVLKRFGGYHVAM